MVDTLHVNMDPAAVLAHKVRSLRPHGLALEAIMTVGSGLSGRLELSDWELAGQSTQSRRMR